MSRLTSGWLASASGCYLMSAYFSSAAAANMCASLYFMFNLLFGGLLLTERNDGIAGVMYLSTFNYGFQVRDACWLSECAIA